MGVLTGAEAIVPAGVLLLVEILAGAEALALDAGKALAAAEPLVGTELGFVARTYPSAGDSEDFDEARAFGTALSFCSLSFSSAAALVFKEVSTCLLLRNI